MRILILSNLFPPETLGGYEILCQQVCSRLHDLGHEIKVLTTTSTKSEKHPFPVQRSLQLYLSFSQGARYARRRRFMTTRANYAITCRTIAEYRPDLIFVWSQLRLTTGCAQAAEDSGVPVAYTMNDEHLAGYASCGKGWKGAAKRILDQNLLKIGISGLQLRNTTCISETVKRRLCGSGVPVESAKVIFQGIPVEKFAAKTNPGELHSPARILYVGQLHGYKGVHTVIEAVALLRRRGVPVELTICGKGDREYESQLRRLAEPSGGRIHFMGQVAHESLAEIYRAHDIFVFPSTWAEPFGLTHLEAMACGTPVVSTAEGGHGEFLRHGVNASIFKPGLAEELAAELLGLLRNPAYARQLAETALHQVHEQFSLQAYVRRLEEWLLECVRERPTRESELAVRRVRATARA